jgi:hypothetical protein
MRPSGNFKFVKHYFNVINLQKSLITERGLVGVA